MRKAFSAVVLAMSVAVATIAAAATQEFKIDPNHSSANFAVKHMMVNTVHGRFAKGVSGAITYDPQDVSKWKVVATIPTASITTDNDARDKHLKSDAFFDVEKYPEIKFESTKVEKRGDHYVATGNLTMKDVSKQIELPFDVAVQTIKGQPVLGATAETTLNRQDYHVKYNSVVEGVTMVGDDVKVELNLEAHPVAPAAK